MANEVNSRGYDASRRRLKAEANKEAVLAAARLLFLERGYAATSVPSVAAAAGVSAETVYKAFGPKSGLVRALWQRALDGQGAVPAPARSDALSAQSGTAKDLVQGWAKLVAEVSPVVSPISLLVKEAASHDPEMRLLMEEIDSERRSRMRLNAKRLLARDGVRRDITVAAAADVLWIYTAPEFFDLLVLRSGWSVERVADFVEDALLRYFLDETGAH
jgi:AcrR family transcriptional regulator